MKIKKCEHISTIMLMCSLVLSNKNNYKLFGIRIISDLDQWWSFDRTGAAMV